MRRRETRIWTLLSRPLIWVHPCECLPGKSVWKCALLACCWSPVRWLGATDFDDDCKAGSWRETLNTSQMLQVQRPYWNIRMSTMYSSHCATSEYIWLIETQAGHTHTYYTYTDLHELTHHMVSVITVSSYSVLWWSLHVYLFDPDRLPYIMNRDWWDAGSCRRVYVRGLCVAFLSAVTTLTKCMSEFNKRTVWGGKVPLLYPKGKTPLSAMDS